MPSWPSDPDGHLAEEARLAAETARAQLETLQAGQWPDSPAGKRISALAARLSTDQLQAGRMIGQISAVGVIANSRMAQVGLGGHEAKVWFANFVAHALVAAAGGTPLFVYSREHLDRRVADRDGVARLQAVLGDLRGPHLDAEGVAAATSRPAQKIAARHDIVTLRE